MDKNIALYPDIDCQENNRLVTVSHSPFPADAVAPGFGQNISATGSTVNLSWTGSDVDGDIVGYDVYLGTTTTPTLLKSNSTDQFLNNITVTSNTGYYWKVITKDSQGNTSDSGLFQFFVNKQTFHSGTFYIQTGRYEDRN
jgi:hypothetical protein